MWRSHLIGLKVTDLSNTVRITSFTRYRTVISPINTGGLCTPSTKTSRGSVLHTPETNYTLKGRWHTEHRTILSAKQSLCWVWEERRSNLKRGGEKKREKSIHVNRNRALFGTRSLPRCFPGLSYQTQDAPPGNSRGRRQSKNGRTITKGGRAEDQNQNTWHLHEEPALQQQFHSALVT